MTHCAIVLLAMSRPKSQLQFHNGLSTQFYFFFLFLQKRDFLYRYWGDIHRRFFSFLQLSPSKQGESFLVLMTPMGLCGRNKSSKNVKKTRGVLSWHPLVAAPNDTEGHGVWKSQKKSHFNIASEASYVYILSGQKFLEKAKNGQLLKNLSLRWNSATRQVTFNRTKIGGKCQKCKIQMRYFFQIV